MPEIVPATDEPPTVPAAVPAVPATPPAAPAPSTMDIIRAWSEPRFDKHSAEEVLKELANELAKPFEDADYFETIYGGNDPPSLGLHQYIKDMVTRNIPHHGGEDLKRLLGKVFLSSYYPGAYEILEFKLDTKAWGSPAGLCPVGFFLYPIGFLGSRSGTIVFPEGMSATDLISEKKPGESAVELVDGWKQKLAALVYHASGDAPSAFVRPPQAVWDKVGKPGNREKRSPLAPGHREPTDYHLRQGILEVVFQCHAPGFRTTYGRSDKEKPACCAGLKITVVGTKATSINVEILEACVHRALAFEPGFEGKPAHEVAPMPEAYTIALQDTILNTVASELERVAVHTEQKITPSAIHGALSFAAPLAERYSQNFTRSGDTSGTQVDFAIKKLAKGTGPTSVSPNAMIQTNILMEVAAQREDLILRADAALPGRTFIVMSSVFRASKYLNHATWEGGADALNARGVVMDFAQKFVQR